MGLRLFKGLCLLFLPNVPGATFIQGGTFIPESRVPLFEQKKCHLMTFSWRLESKRRGKMNHKFCAKNMPCLKTQMPKFKIKTPESVATARLPCANIASGSFSLSHFLLSPLKTKRGKRAMFSSSSHFEDEPLLKLSQLPCFYPQYTHRSQLERSHTVVIK